MSVFGAKARIHLNIVALLSWHGQMTPLHHAVKGIKNPDLKTGGFRSGRKAVYRPFGLTALRWPKFFLFFWSNPARVDRRLDRGEIRDNGIRGNSPEEN